MIGPGAQHTLRDRGADKNVTFEENRKTQRHALRFAAMALIKDHTGRVVQRFSEAYPLEGPIDRVHLLKRGRIRFKRQFWIPAGRYTLWTRSRAIRRRSDPASSRCGSRCRNNLPAFGSASCP